MATKDTPSGLLARVTNFVRSPSAGSETPGSGETAEGAENAKLTIARMIERKAHNDAVRKREFDQLRKLRQVSQAVASEMVARPSFFSDSMGHSTLEDRTSTLKKIDEIEAQMSKQWWKTRQGALDAAKANPSPEAVVAPVQKSAAPTDACDTFAATVRADATEDAHSAAKADAAELSRPPSQSSYIKGTTAVSNSKRMSLYPDWVVSDAILEEAAIRFANHDDVGAETILMAALNDRSAAPQSIDAWTAALFDLYRSTGQQANFDSFVMDYSVRFDRAGPVWFSTPEALGLSAPSAAGGSHLPQLANTPGTWICPTALDTSSVAQLNAVVNINHSPCRLDWRLLKTITPEAGQALVRLLALWCEQPLKFQLEGIEVLDAVLRAKTVVGDRHVPQFWWHCHMNVLRILTSKDAFELLAMEFCITYEVSPPSWQAAQCQLMATPRNERSLRTQTACVETSTLALSGEVLGSDADSLKYLQLAARDQPVVLVNCDVLIRVDFSAAGSILNWVTNEQEAGREVEFHHVPRLVASFFSLIGINEHAQITVRDN